MGDGFLKRININSSIHVAARKCLRIHLKRIRRIEYNKLQSLVPSIKTKDKVSKVAVIEEAIRYIDDLHNALVRRFQEKKVAELPDVNIATVKDFVKTKMVQPSSDTASDDIKMEENDIQQTQAQHFMPKPDKMIT